MPRKKTTPEKKTNEKKVTEYPKVTLTITTCKRYDYFERTLKAFFLNCQDLDLIDSIIISDDNSPQLDIDKMKNFMIDFNHEVTLIQHAFKSHYKSLNLLFQAVQTDYIFHLEDDWELFEKTAIIRKCFDTMIQHKKMLSVICRHWDSAVKIPGTNYWMQNYNGKTYDR